MITAFQILADVLEMVLMIVFFIKTAKSYYKNDTHSMIFNGMLLIVLCI